MADDEAVRTAYFNGRFLVELSFTTSVCGGEDFPLTADASLGLLGLKIFFNYGVPVVPLFNWGRDCGVRFTIINFSVSFLLILTGKQIISITLVCLRDDIIMFNFTVKCDKSFILVD